MRLEGYSYYEIASEAGISESSARGIFPCQNETQAVFRKGGPYHDPDHL